MYKNNFNCYICPTKIYPYIRAILVRCWYWSLFFPEVYLEGYTEMNSSVPSDIYEKVLEEAKKNYLADTNDDTFDDWNNKKEVIDKYCTHKFPLSDSPKYTHSCPIELIDFVKNILARCWYSFEIIESNDKVVTFKSNLREDAYPKIIERAKMELLSDIHNDCLYVSPKEEENENGWLSYMMHDYWHTYFYFMPTNYDLEMLDKIGDDKI